MGKQAAEEIRRELLEEDSTKDVSFYLSVSIGIIAGISAIGAVCAVIVTRALLYFRGGVDAYWLSCVPFLFPVITGLFAAYKKQFSLLGVHLTVTLLALLMGGFGFGLSVEPIFIRRHQCVPVTRSVDCDKSSLAFLYLVSGSLAAGFAVLGFILTLCALNSATIRMEKRRRQAEEGHLQEQEQKQKELHQKKRHVDVTKPRTLSVTSPTTSQNTGTNGIPQVPPQKNSGTAESKKKGADVTTKL